MRPSIAILKTYLEELLTINPDYKGIKEEVARSRRVIKNMEKEKGEKKMSNIFKTFQDLLEFIELHDVTDETDYDAGGQPYGTRTKHFGYLIDKAREELEELAHLPYPVTNTFNKNEAPLTQRVDKSGVSAIMSSLSYPPLRKEE